MSTEQIHAQQTRDTLEGQRAHAIVQVIDDGAEVRRRHQFFIWTQGSVQALLPHQLAVCGVYERQLKEVRLEVFNSIVVPPILVQALTDGCSPLMQYIINAWVDNRGRSMIVRLPQLASRVAGGAVEALQSLGFDELLVHGVSRPRRASEIETLFVFSSPGQPVTAAHAASIELMIPHLHTAYLRVQATERDMAKIPARPLLSGNGYAGASISEREEEVLGWVREGLSNQEIGLKLGISALTVKNHVQKILRKLGATNRAQAVARAMSLNLLVGKPGDDERR